MEEIIKALKTKPTKVVLGNLRTEDDNIVIEKLFNFEFNNTIKPLTSLELMDSVHKDRVEGKLK